MKEELTFESYTTKSGVTGKKRWKLFLLKTEDGRVFSTFDTEFVILRKPMEIEYEEEETDSGFTRRRIISPEDGGEAEIDAETGGKPLKPQPTKSQVLSEECWARLENLILESEDRTKMRLEYVLKELRRAIDNEDVSPDELPKDLGGEKVVE